MPLSGFLHHADLSNAPDPSSYSLHQEESYYNHTLFTCTHFLKAEKRATKRMAISLSSPLIPLVQPPHPHPIWDQPHLLSLILCQSHSLTSLLSDLVCPGSLSCQSALLNSTAVERLISSLFPLCTKLVPTWLPREHISSQPGNILAKMSPQRQMRGFDLRQRLYCAVLYWIGS